MNARLSLRAALLTVALLVPLAAVAPSAAPSAEAAASPSASLRVTPGSGYIGGQAMRFQGNIGRTGVRRIMMQFHMGNGGDGWAQVQGFRGSTRADGSFNFVSRAPSMFGVRYRVVSGSLATPPKTFNAGSQDLTVEVVGRPVAGRPFDLGVDTTPALHRRPDTLNLRPYVGRKLTLQRRLGDDSWQKVGTSQVGQYGMGYFRNVTVNKPGTVVYRVLQGNWTKGGNQIGWFPSFPTYVHVRSSAAAATTVLPSPVQRTATPTSTPAAATPLARGGSLGAAAAQRFGWAPSLFDFAWEYGESLTSRAHRGRGDLNGWWLDYSNGSGRASKHNGGLMLDSKRINDAGPGDFGSTSATLRGLPMTYGRWETKMRIKSHESRARDYRVKVELVPHNLSAEKCGARNITVAQIAPNGNSVMFGVNAGNKKWTRTVSGVRIQDHAIALAVEVSKGHITWFMGGRPVATVKNKAAVPGVPMTLRISMLGNGNHEMNHTQAISDWQRGFSITRGKQVKSGAAMKRSSYRAPNC
ncbi:MAG: hypothetical protein ACXWDL_06580 [Nocardioides sp.]